MQSRNGWSGAPLLQLLRALCSEIGNALCAALHLMARIRLSRFPSHTWIEAGLSLMLSVQAHPVDDVAQETRNSSDTLYRNVPTAHSIRSRLSPLVTRTLKIFSLRVYLERSGSASRSINFIEANLASSQL